MPATKRVKQEDEGSAIVSSVPVPELELSTREPVQTEIVATHEYSVTVC